MLTKPIVLVLGAGASVPFGFPTGRNLSELIVQQLRSGQAGFKALQQYGGYTDDEINLFRQTFSRSGQNSIDAFLEHRSDLLGIGKAATAQALIRFESEEKLFSFDAENWLR